MGSCITFFNGEATAYSKTRRSIEDREVQKEGYLSRGFFCQITVFGFINNIKEEEEQAKNTGRKRDKELGKGPVVQMLRI